MFTRETPKRTIRLKKPLVPVLVLILLVVQLFFPFRGWVILLSGFGGMWLISYLWARGLKKGLQVNRDMSFGWKQVGDRLRERVLLENNSWVPSLWVNLDDHSNMRDYKISAVTDVGGWRYRNWHTQGTCNHRGLFTLGPLTLKTEDPFGIYQVNVDYNESVNMMVVPPVVPLPEIEIASGGRVGDGRSSSRGLKQTVNSISVREYVPGDSLRWLHWPTIARTGELYVHLFENEPTSDWWVLLDMDEKVQVGKGHLSTEEHGVMLAASLVNRGIQLGKHVGLISHGNNLVWHLPGIGDSHLWSVLRSLAMIRPGGLPLAEILQRLRLSLGRDSSLIVITSNPDPAWIFALEKIRRIGIVPTILLLDPESFGGEGNMDAIRYRLRKLEVRHHTITSDLMDRPQKPARRDWEWLMSTQPTGEISSPWEYFKEKAGRAIRTWGLVFLFYYVFAGLLQGAVRGLEGSQVWVMILGALTIGSVLAYSKLSGWFVGFLCSLTGVLVSFLRVGSLWDEILDAIVRVFRILPTIVDWAYRSQPILEVQPLLLRLSEIWYGITAIGTRLLDWGTNLIQGNSFYDPVAITFLWSIAIWSVAAWSVWRMIRYKQPLSGFLPPLALVAVSAAIVEKTAYDLVFMLGTILALMVFIHHDVRERVWLTSRLRFTRGIRRNILLAAVLLTVILMAFSLITPSVSIESIADTFRTLTQDETGSEPQIVESFGFTFQDEETDIDPLSSVRFGGLPNRHLIGSGDELSDQVVMVVKAESPQVEVLHPPFYLQSFVYDKYIGYGWESRPLEIRDYAPGQVILPDQPISGIPVRQQVQFVEADGGFIYTNGSLSSVDQDFRIAWRIRDTQNGIYDIFGGRVEENRYRADSYVNMFSPDELSAAGQDYPEWITARYMRLPATVPDEVLALALEITATGATPYDRAVAIERYLRQIPYDLKVSIGPAGADIVEYFLFQLKKGYCDYYATAMVVLARAAGIPARYVTGYIAESYDADEGAFIITADQAHAWPEIYFPGMGWVPFEPTGGRPAIERPQEPIPQLPETFSFDFSPLVSDPQFSWGIILTVFFGIFLGFILILFVVKWVSDWWAGRLPTEILLPKLFKRVYHYARWSNMKVRAGDTAYQFAERLIDIVHQIGRESYLADWFLAGEEMVREMTFHLVQYLFNPHHKQVDPKHIFQLYKQLRMRLLFLVLLTKAYPHRILRVFFWENPPLFISVPSEEI